MARATMTEPPNRETRCVRAAVIGLLDEVA
jgi:hypothetical protein